MLDNKQNKHNHSGNKILLKNNAKKEKVFRAFTYIFRISDPQK